MRLNVECQDDLLEEFRTRAWVRQERRAEAENLALDEQRKQRRT